MMLNREVSKVSRQVMLTKGETLNILYTPLAYTNLSKKKYMQFVYAKLGLFPSAEICYDVNKREGENHVYISGQ